MLLLFHVNVSIYDLSGEKEPLGFLIDLLVLFFVKEKKPLVGMDLLAIFRVKNCINLKNKKPKTLILKINNINLRLDAPMSSS